jgi:hypothetical protein
MVKAGDGAPRSETRKLDSMVSLRISAAEKQQFTVAGKQQSYGSFAAFHLDCLRKGSGLSLRKEQIIVGRLGGIGADIQSLAQRCDGASLPDTSERLLVLNERIAARQRDVMIGDGDAGQEDP